MSSSQVVVIGAGPAGLSAYLGLREHHSVKMLDCGKNFLDRISDTSSTSLVNGMGGAGMYSDRKISGFPAGTGLTKQNPCELRDSFRRIIDHLKTAVPEKAMEFEALFMTINHYLGDNTIPSETLERKSMDFGNMKKYPSVVLDTYEQALQLLRYYFEQIHGGEVYFESTVTNITYHPKFGYTVHFVQDGTSGQLQADVVVMATGRFGPFQMSKFSAFADNTSRRRIEYGVRLNLDLYNPLKVALQNHQDDSDMIVDPKLVIRKSMVIGGRPVECEFRTFCVCIPSTGSGYSVVSVDQATGLTTVSGSSSFDEIENRSDYTGLIPGSNLGIMVRIYDDDIIDTYTSDLFDRCSSSNNDGSTEFATVCIDPSSDTDYTDYTEMNKWYPQELSHALYNGVVEVIHALTGHGVDTSLTLHGPCIEGAGVYPDVDQRSYQVVGHPGVFVAGDCVGHTRGLLQAFVMGDMCAKYVKSYLLSETLHASTVLKEYQDIMLPASSYNKVLSSDYTARDYVDTSDALNRELDRICVDFYDEEWLKFKERYNDIESNLKTVDFIGSTNFGVLYEIHHFFLDKNIYGNTDQLHYISQEAMIKYITLCNLVENSKERIANKIIRYLLLEINRNNLHDEYDDMLHQSIVDTIMNYTFKSCVLALRIRSSIEEREDFTDIPVMQSAFKMCPFKKDVYETVGEGSYKSLKTLEKQVIASTCAYLDTLFDIMITNHDLPLIMCRSKIETQEPSIVPTTGEAIYYECHIKVNMKKGDGSDMGYYEKKQVIQDLAGLVEGPNAMVGDIFNVISVSINLLKHPEHGQQFFLTYRTDTKEQMEHIRRNFKPIMDTIVEQSSFPDYRFTYLTDAEFVIYDNNRPLDLPWFPIESHFISLDYKETIKSLTTATKHVSLVTTSDDKLREYRQMCKTQFPGTFFHKCTLDLGETSSTSLEDDVRRKALKAFGILNRRVIVESSGLVLPVYGEFPGALTKQVHESMTLDDSTGFTKRFGNLDANAVTFIATYDGLEDVKIYHSCVTGRISALPSGSNGFGWDNVFIPSGHSLTFADMTPETKNNYSMRGRALDLYGSSDSTTSGVQHVVVE